MQSHAAVSLSATAPPLTRRPPVSHAQDPPLCYTLPRGTARSHFLYMQVTADDEEGRCAGSHICYWLESILEDSPAGDDADWLSIHRYFTDYDRSWVMRARVHTHHAHTRART
jgi:hypothetical protein